MNTCTAEQLSLAISDHTVLYIHVEKLTLNTVSTYSIDILHSNTLPSVERTDKKRRKIKWTQREVGNEGMTKRKKS